MVAKQKLNMKKNKMLNNSSHVLPFIRWLRTWSSVMVTS